MFAVEQVRQAVTAYLGEVAAGCEAKLEGKQMWCCNYRWLSRHQMVRAIKLKLLNTQCILEICGFISPQILDPSNSKRDRS
jgi:hypothetical protein